MLKVYARTREREVAWKLGAYCLGGSLIAAPIVNLIVRESGKHGPFRVRILAIRQANQKKLIKSRCW